MSEKKAKIQLTGLWRKQSNNGEFMVGSISSRASLLIFPNGFKKKETDPDFIAYIAENEPKDRPRNSLNESDIPF